MALYDSNEDFGDQKPRSGPQNVSGYVFSMMMVAVIVIIALALLYAVAQPSTHLAGRGATTVEAVMTPTPLPEPLPATEPRPTQAPVR
jgi:hypothetical protein